MLACRVSMGRGARERLNEATPGRQLNARSGHRSSRGPCTRADSRGQALCPTGDRGTHDTARERTELTPRATLNDEGLVNVSTKSR
jgi:hypothetical protein